MTKKWLKGCIFGWTFWGEFLWKSFQPMGCLPKFLSTPTSYHTPHRHLFHPATTRHLIAKALPQGQVPQGIFYRLARWLRGVKNSLLFGREISSSSKCGLDTPPEFNFPPEKWWFETFQGRTVTLRGGIQTFWTWVPKLAFLRKR